jgi:hypothetical protein
VIAAFVTGIILPVFIIMGIGMAFRIHSDLDDGVAKYISLYIGYFSFTESSNQSMANDLDVYPYAYLCGFAIRDWLWLLS